MPSYSLEGQVYYFAKMLLLLLSEYADHSTYNTNFLRTLLGGLLESLERKIFPVYETPVVSRSGTPEPPDSLCGEVLVPPLLTRM